MAKEKKISRRGFLATGPAVAAGAAISAKGITQEAELVHGTPPSGIPLRVQSMISVLTKKELIDPKALDKVIEFFETKVGPHYGASVVARAWVDPVFKENLLKDANPALEDFELPLRNQKCKLDGNIFTPKCFVRCTYNVQNVSQVYEYDG